MTIEDIWITLNNGGRVTNGEMIVSYTDSVLAAEGVDLKLIPFNNDNCEDWDEYEEPTNEKLYYRLIRETSEKIIEITETWCREDYYKNDSFSFYGEGYTRAELLADKHD